MGKSIVFYDGDCGFCNRTVAYVIKHEKSASIHFCALQSEFSKAFFKELELPEPDHSTFYFYDGNKMYSKSTAALRLAKRFKFPTNLLQVGWIFPRFIRDYGYDLIAKRRHRLSKGYCFLPSKREKERFI